MAVILTGTEYVDLDAHGAALDIRSAPLAVYAEIDTTDGGTMIVYNHGRDTGVGEYMIYMNSGAAVFRISTTNDWSDVSGGSGLDDGSLHRLLGVFRANGDQEIWVDGTLENSTTRGTTSVEDDNDDTKIGTRADVSLNFDGELSNIAVWDVDISASDAEDLTDGTIGPDDLTTGQLAHWPLDFDARDISGNERDGTTVGDPDFTESEPDITGDGEATAPPAEADGTGAVTVAGTGEATAPAATADGAAEVTVSGTGEATAPAATVDGDGAVEQPGDTRTGTGAATAPAATLDGAASVTVGGDGATLAPAALLDGAGAVVVTGSGALTAPAAVASGSDLPDIVSTVHATGRYLPTVQASGAYRPTVAATGRYRPIVAATGRIAAEE